MVVRRIAQLRWGILLALIILPGQFSHALGAAGTESASVSDFTLATHRGQPWSLSDVADQQLVVITFLGTDCPLARLYGPRLAELHRTYQDRGVAFVGINANTQDSLTEIATYVTKHQIPFPVLKDVANRVADQLQAERTPEVFVLDQDRRVRYQGRIDDQYLVGQSRDEIRRRDLAIALDQLLAGQPVTVSRTEALGCHIGRVSQVEPTGDVTWSNHIARIINTHCVECHRSGQVAPFSLTSYEDVIGWEDTILEVIADNRMPPWYANPAHGTFRNDPRLSEEDQQLLRTWIDNGMPAGDLTQLPDPPQFAAGWRMPEPDQVIAIRDEPFAVPAEGVVDYQYFSVDPGWDEDKYVVAAEARPDNTAVVHHIIAYVIPPEDAGQKSRHRTMLVGYAPGAVPNVPGDGIAMHVPAGSQLLFEMHYTPNGVPQTDRSYIGLKFTERENVRNLLKGRAASNHKFEIPPGAASHEVTAEYRSRRDEWLLRMTPHMHIRGKSFRYEAFYPDGRQEVLLDVPRYDFNWQLGYELAEARLLPEGTRIVCTATYDNSESNPVNPDPGKSVRWGDQSWEEMMIGFFDVVETKPFRTTLPGISDAAGE